MNAMILGDIAGGRYSEKSIREEHGRERSMCLTGACWNKKDDKPQKVASVSGSY